MAVSGDILDGYYLALTLLVTIGVQLSMFAVAWTFQFDKVTDISGSMNFVLLAWLTYWLRGTYHTRQTVCLVLLTVWGVRLGAFLLYRVLQRGKDERFDEMRESFGRFLGFWIFQIVWVWVVSLPVVMLNGSRADAALGASDVAGWALFGVGFVFEVCADQSKHAFSADPQNRGKFLRINVWSVSRHPNYFGEITLWVGFFVMSVAAFDANSRWCYFAVVSPVLTFVLLMFVSGIPLGEERYDKRYGRDPLYREYKRTTPPLIPLPGALYGALPDFAKLMCCCEFPFYSSALPSDADLAAAGAGGAQPAPLLASAATTPAQTASEVTVAVAP